ncbi:hypothetical protein K490DRAFT_42965 [Saccharata proteae CBS 121410]|uniref:Uncharacterized protein n=1 Tax=Saccharata proteae CBS 121410 TaxID=1314787 RepID=A0A9P4LWE9_9PEZI|nr:hypothetical protein K490DRAFT_42965 [Saccharata proteae CBS 121410]
MKWSLLLPLLSLASFSSSSSSQPQQPISLSASTPFLNFSSPAPYIFSSIYGLLQQWPNSFFPNGHTIAACEIPRHTVLYHGRHDAELPPSPEWLSFDVEMAYAIMGSLPDSHMLTYRTARPVKALYFDGMSANLMSPGIEAQMTFLYGDSKSKGPPDFGGWNPLEDEYFRAQGLCRWVKEKGLGGKGWGFEGIVRMNAAFELIWCDFDSPSLQLVSNLNVSVPRIETRDQDRERKTDDRKRDFGRTSLIGSLDAPEGPHGPGMTDRSEPFRDFANWGWFTAAARHYGFSGMGLGRGESRAKVDTCSLFTFYDPALEGQNIARIEEERKSLNISETGTWIRPDGTHAKQIALEQLMRRRRPHRTNHVSKADGTVMRAAVEGRLRIALNSSSCSGIDWQLTGHEILITYASGLRNLLGLLSQSHAQKPGNWSSLRAWFASIRVQTHWFLIPYFEYPPQPYTKTSLKQAFHPQSPYATAALLRCKSQYSISDPENTLAHGERLLSWATDEVLTGICTAIVHVGMGVEYEWLSAFNKDDDPRDDDGDDFDGPSLLRAAKKWQDAIEELMAWLGWVDQWTGCHGPCAADELCYIPMWPATGRSGGAGRGGGPPSRRPGKGDGEPTRSGEGGWGDEEKSLWEPVCVNMSSFPS